MDPCFATAAITVHGSLRPRFANADSKAVAVLKHHDPLAKSRMAIVMLTSLDHSLLVHLDLAAGYMSRSENRTANVSMQMGICQTQQRYLTNGVF